MPTFCRLISSSRRADKLARHGFWSEGSSGYIGYIRTQTRPAIEFVSDEEGLSPKSYYIEFSFLEFVFTVIQEYVMAPGSSFGAEEDGGTAPLAVTGPSVAQCVVSLLPVI